LSCVVPHGGVYSDQASRPGDNAKDEREEDPSRRPRRTLDDGKVIYTGPAAELAKDEERVRAMAGASAEEWSLPG